MDPHLRPNPGSDPVFRPDEGGPAETYEYADALPAGPGQRVKGRGAGLKPGNRFEDVRLHVLGEYLDHQKACGEEPSRPTTEVFEDDARSIINQYDSPDMGGRRWSLNPYRGCEHGCIYCYARPGHEYLSMSCGIDFETKIFAKKNAPALLRKALMSSKWKGEALMMSGVTDPYQPIEREQKVSRGCLEVLAEFRQCVFIITKNTLVLRDLDLLQELNRHRAVGVALSVTSLNNHLASIMEPRAAAPRQRLAVIKALADAGIPVTVMAAPMIPRINDHEMPLILKAAREAGATAAGSTLVRLPYQLKSLFSDWLTRHFPDRAQHVESLIKQIHGGKLYDSRWFIRHSGQGPFAEQYWAQFEVFKKKFGFGKDRRGPSTAAFRRPGDLFGPAGPGEERSQGTKKAITKERSRGGNGGGPGGSGQMGLFG